jgi:hypothetical protein
MQKNAISQILREEIMRASIFALAFFIFILSGFVWIAYAADNGWFFGILLNKILVTAWDEPANDGTVKNAASLGGNPADAYVPLHATSRSCGSDQCIYGFDTDGSVLCR